MVEGVSVGDEWEYCLYILGGIFQVCVIYEFENFEVF